MFHSAQPFPFPHSQLSAFYVLIAVPAIAFLMDQYCEDTWLGCILTFLTVTALSGVHEVARELENPFRNVPNEIPLATLMAEANEAILTMYAGYNPDFFWADAAKQYAPSEEPPAEPTTAKPEPKGNSSAAGEAEAEPKENSSVAGEAKGSELEEKINQLMMKIEEQSRELDLLRANMEGEKKIA